jgi:hypothetical protein
VKLLKRRIDLKEEMLENLEMEMELASTLNVLRE